MIGNMNTSLLGQLYGGENFGNANSFMQSAQNDFYNGIPPINVGYYNAADNNPATYRQPTDPQQMDPMQYQQYMLQQYQQQMNPQQQMDRNAIPAADAATVSAAAVPSANGSV
jgi:hypothetical protein